ncbi:putative histone acetyltransferase HAC12-like [Sesbania bispinosa]|nr:putative histone acetyltransferase HAC12-like [Sesbania bispinosa]
MHAKGSSSFVPNLPQQRGFDLSQQYVRNQAGFCTDWRKPPEMRYKRYFIRNKISAILSSSIHCEQAKQSSDIATILEHRLFIHAASKEDYMNQETLVQRVQTQLNKMYRTKGIQQQVDSPITYTYKTVPSSGFLHAWSNGSLPEPAFQKVAAPVINAIDYCAVNTKNKYDLPKGGLFNTSIVHEPVLPPHCSSITACTDMDMDVLSNFSVSGGGCNPEASSKSIISYFPRQHANDLEMDLKKYSCLGTIQKNESMAFHSTMGPLQSESLNLMISQHVSRENLEGSNLLPALMQPYDLCDKASTSTVQYMLPPDKRLEMESAFGVSLMNNASSDQWTHKMALPYSSEAPFGNSEAMLPPAKRLKMESAFGVSLMNNASSEQWTHKMAQPYSSEAPPGNSEAMLPPDKILEMESAFGVSFMNNASSDQWTHKMAQPYSSEAPSATVRISPIHSEVTECTAEQFTNPMLDSISIDEIKNSGIDDTFGQSFKRETIPSKGLEVDHISEEPDPKSHNMINSSNLEETVIKLNSSMHTLCKDTIAADIEDIQGKTGFNQAEINGEKKVIEPKADQEKETKTSNTVISEINGLTNCLINNSSSDQWTHKMAQPYASEALSELQQHSESPLSSIDSEVTECNVEQFTNSMFDSMSISEIKNSAIDDTFGQNFKNETVPSEGLEAGHISEEPDPKSHDVVDRSNLEETVIGSNSNKHTLCEDPIAADIEDIQIKTGSNHAGLNAKKEVSEPKVDQEKETKSSNTTVNIVSLTESFTSTQIMEHIKGLRKKFVQGISEEETGIAASTCQLCAMEKLFFHQCQFIAYVVAAGSREMETITVRKQKNLIHNIAFATSAIKILEVGQSHSMDYLFPRHFLIEREMMKYLKKRGLNVINAKDGNIKYVPLYNKRRDLDRSAEYICPICRLKEIENGMHVPYPKTAIFGAKDLPRTMLVTT